MLVLLVGNVINLTIAQLTPKFFEVDPHTVQPSSCCILRPDQASWKCQALYTHGSGTQHRKTLQCRSPFVGVDMDLSIKV